MGGSTGFDDISSVANHSRRESLQWNRGLGSMADLSKFTCLMDLVSHDAYTHHSGQYPLDSSVGKRGLGRVRLSSKSETFNHGNAIIRGVLAENRFGGMHIAFRKRATGLVRAGCAGSLKQSEDPHRDPS
jgi:hypothetical protein